MLGRGTLRRKKRLTESFTPESWLSGLLTSSPHKKFGDLMVLDNRRLITMKISDLEKKLDETKN